MFSAALSLGILHLQPSVNMHQFHIVLFHLATISFLVFKFLVGACANKSLHEDMQTHRHGGEKREGILTNQHSSTLS
jgi:hypothetical protein